MKFGGLLIFVALLGSFNHCLAGSGSRLAVIENRKLQKGFEGQIIVFHVDRNYLRVKIGDKWFDLGNPSSTVGLVSNPVAAYTKKNETQVFSQASDGQVYSRIQNGTDKDAMPFSKWFMVSPAAKLRFNSSVAINGLDSVSVGEFKGETVLFAREWAEKSRLHWCKGDGTSFGNWSAIGGNDAHLASDASIVYNRFSKFFEAFAVTGDNEVHRTWQKSDKEWADWRIQGDNSPKVVSTSRPTASLMQPSWTNSMVEVFALGTDGHIYHIWQTTCDHFDNPWGWCTWWLWEKAGNKTPSLDTVNTLAVGHNIHDGNELFTIGKDGNLWHMWQLEHGKDWKDWEVVGKPEESSIASLPFIRTSEQGWWEAYLLDSNNKVCVIQQNRSLTPTPNSLDSGSNLTVSWMVPKDEATNMDWIALLAKGAANDEYLDYRYVQGGQNPKKDVVPSGSVQFQSFLPTGSYEGRYMVNRKMASVMSAAVSYTKGPTDVEWIQLYHGLDIGLGLKSGNLVTCVDDGNKTVQTFHAAFDAFENREVYTGLHLIAEALGDIVDTLKACAETDMATAIEKFIQDLVKCTETDCTSFVFDIVNELLIILYEDIYEIFGDILAASNCFDLKAYEQGGVAIGRVVSACISLPK